MALRGYIVIVPLGCLLGAALLMAWPRGAWAQQYADPPLPAPPHTLAKLLSPIGVDEPVKEKNGDDKKDAENKTSNTDWYSFHAQTTVVGQGVTPFHSPYSGALSFQSPPKGLPGLSENFSGAVSETATLFMAFRFWENSEIIFNPEVAGGQGLSGANGIAGFPNGEITRVGIAAPTPYFARLLWRQTIGLGGETEKVEDGVNQAKGNGVQDVSRIVFGFGRFAATDIFDDNDYSHDPRSQFMNWSLMYNGAWDYPANVRGYDNGAYVELNQKDWAIRYGVFQVAAVANGSELDSRILKGNGHAVEFEQRWELDGHKGEVKWLAYMNLAHMGSYALALQQNPTSPDVTQSRAYRIRYGFGYSFQQEICKDLGFFSRFGWNNGQDEAWMFTPIDLTVSAGLLLKGTSWSRPEDRIGLAGVSNGLSLVHQHYLEAGGSDFNLGDGKITYGMESSLETFYNCAITKNLFLSGDFQFCANPGYNRDRGPVTIYTIRAQARF
ncbi:MAG TPA: carbohydrate porin [Gemmataceae bacterium]|jgi:high affinity Mn2+ porin|nr:carbohydrate porin [Gemmataceae bacterium]